MTTKGASEAAAVAAIAGADSGPSAGRSMAVPSVATGSASPIRNSAADVKGRGAGPTWSAIAALKASGSPLLIWATVAADSIGALNPLTATVSTWDASPVLSSSSRCSLWSYIVQLAIDKVAKIVTEPSRTAMDSKGPRCRGACATLLLSGGTDGTVEPY